MPRDGNARSEKTGTALDLTFRTPTDEDGSAVWQLIQDINVLDDNSMYCNLLQCTHFAETCALAEREGKLLGWVSGYRPPSDPDALFVWQVATHPSARGEGVASRLIHWVLDRPANADITQIHSTITRSNTASWALFGSMAKAYGAELNHEPHFERERHFDGESATEYLVRIAPLRRERLAQAA